MVLILWIEFFIERRQMLSHTSETDFTTVSNKSQLTFELYIERPMQMVELKLIMIIEENDHIMNASDRTTSHPLIRKHSHMPFKN